MAQDERFPLEPARPNQITRSTLMSAWNWYAYRVRSMARPGNLIAQLEDDDTMLLYFMAAIYSLPISEIMLIRMSFVLHNRNMLMSAVRSKIPLLPVDYGMV